MTTKEFNKIVEKRIERCKQVLVRKADEYARGDRLSNFKKAGGALGCSPMKALIGMWMEHVISIVDLVDDYEAGRMASQDMWNEKIGNAINCLFLLDGLVHEVLSPGNNGKINYDYDEMAEWENKKEEENEMVSK